MVGFTKSAGIVPRLGRAEAERRHQLIAQGRLPGPRPSDAELLATLGTDLDAFLAEPRGGLRLGGLPLRRGPKD